MTGSLRERNGKFYIILKFKNEKGEWKQKQIATGLVVKDNKRKAEKIMREFLNESSDENLYKSKEILFVDYLKHWFKSKISKTEKVTIDGYNFLLKRHIIPYFEPMKLKIQDIKPIHISTFYNFKATDGRIDGKNGGCSWETLNKYKMVLNGALKQATYEELIVRNPAENIKLPLRKEKVREVKFLEAHQATSLIELFKGHRLQPLIITTLYYGLRRSEVLGLKWDAINFENDVLEIKHTVVESTEIVRKDRTKTKSSRRKFILLPDVKKILKSLKTEQEENKKLFGKDYQKTDYVFTWQDGRPYRPDYIQHAFTKTLKKNNFPHMAFHDLRHSTASILYDKGWELKDIQKWLGHSNIQTTGNIYTHISNSREKNLAKDLNGTFKLNAV